MGEGGLGGAIGVAGSRRGDSGGWACGGLDMPPKPSIASLQAPLTSPCPSSNHTITPNLTLTFVASWFSHASHVGWAEQDLPNFVHGSF